jgi:hypothetical protein
MTCNLGESQVHQGRYQDLHVTSINATSDMCRNHFFPIRLR